MISRWRGWLAAIGSYAALSILAFVAQDVEPLHRTVDSLWSWIWLLGPPTNLLYKTAAFPLYAIETALLLAIAVAVSMRRTRVAALALTACALAVWLLSGALAVALLI
jgi:hypothetical protein